MARKRIFSIGFKIPQDEDEPIIEEVPFLSNRSLMDADIIILEPRLPASSRIGSEGVKDAVTEYAIHHWRSEIQASLEYGKTIVVFMTKQQWLYSSATEFSDNYSMIPVNLHKIVSKHGEEILQANDLGVLADYWREFAEWSSYEAYLEGEFKDILLTTKTRDKVVSTVIYDGKGAVILLPYLQYDEDEFTEEENGEQYWTDEAIAFGKRLVARIVEIDRLLRSNRGISPIPDWAKNPKLYLEKEIRLKESIEEVAAELQELYNKRIELEARLQSAGSLRRLLYERGEPLEDAIIESLKLLGFEAERYKESDSEFDVVFVSAEGRFIGEAEGKDNRAINIDKLSQLARNLDEDFARDEVSEYAKGVLFGNAFRLQPLEERQVYFTDKCISSAKLKRIALVRTPDLFRAAKYLSEHDDSDFATACRMRIYGTEGEIVEFPDVPIE